MIMKKNYPDSSMKSWRLILGTLFLFMCCSFFSNAKVIDKPEKANGNLSNTFAPTAFFTRIDQRTMDGISADVYPTDYFETFYDLLAGYAGFMATPPDFTVGHADDKCGLGIGELWIASVDASTGSGSVSTWRWHFTTDPTWTIGISPWFSVTTKVTNMPAGDYYVEVEDGAGVSTRKTVPETVGDIPSDLIFSTAHADASCGLANGELWISSIDASTGNGSVSSWRWHYTNDPTWQSNVSPWYGLTTKVTNVPGGVYYIEIEDGIGCRKEASEPVIILSDLPVCELNWIYSDFVNPLCGEHEINTLMVSVSGGTGKYTIDFTFSNPDWFIAGGNSGEIDGEGDHNFIFHAGGNEGSLITIALAEYEFPECITTCEIEIDHCKAESFCTFTPGFYGNEGGLGCMPDGNAFPAYDLMDDVMSVVEDPVLFGSVTNGWHLFREDITSGHIFRMLPGGGTPASFIAIDGIPVGCYSNSLSWPKVPLSKTKRTLGSIQNSLFSQTVTFFFNMNLAGDKFKAISLEEKYIVTTGIVECGQVQAVTNANLFREIPRAVIDFLGNPANGYSADADGLFMLANDILGGGIMGVHYVLIAQGKKNTIKWLISPAEVTEALDALNSLFDKCRILIGQFDELPGFIHPAAKEERKSIIFRDSEIVERGLSELKVYPNPFRGLVTFEFVSGHNANARLEIFNMLGQKVTTLLDQPVEQGVMNRFEYRPLVTSGMLFYRFSLDNEIFNGKMIYSE
jgi:hypothetical protein